MVLIHVVAVLQDEVQIVGGVLQDDEYGFDCLARTHVRHEQIQNLRRVQVRLLGGELAKDLYLCDHLLQLPRVLVVNHDVLDRDVAMRHEATALEHDTVLAFSLNGHNLITLQHSLPEILCVSVRQVGKKFLANGLDRLVLNDADLVGKVALAPLDLEYGLIYLAFDWPDGGLGL